MVRTSFFLTVQRQVCNEYSERKVLNTHAQVNLYLKTKLNKLHICLAEPTFNQTNNNDLLEKAGGTKNCIYMD